MNTSLQSDETLPANETLTHAAQPRRSELYRSWRRFKRFRPAVASLVFLGFLIVIAIVPQVFQPYSHVTIDTSHRGEGPSWAHPLGYDQVGRDILSRIIRGTRVAFIAGLTATAIAVTIGVTVGATAGYFGGWVDQFLSRIVDAMLAFPTLVLLMTLAGVLGPSLVNTIVIIGVTSWAGFSRVVRADVLSLRERDFVLAAQASGAGNFRIIARHITPNVLGPVIVLATLGVGGMILTVAALSFLGLGVTPPTPSWGAMLSESRSYLTIYPHIAVAPGIMIFLTVLAFNLLGDGLRDALDPRQQD